MTDGVKTRIDLLGRGSIHVSGEDRSGRIRYRRTPALLAYLLVEKGTHHDRDHLADLLWPNLPLDAARANLRQIVRNLVQLLSDGNQHPPWLEVGRSHLGAIPHPTLEVDVFWLDQAPQKVCQRCDGLTCRLLGYPHNLLAGGPQMELLAGLSLEGCDSFDQWLTTRRQLLRNRAIDLLDGLAACALEHQRIEEALEWSARLEQIDPLLEANQRRLMTVYALAGQQERALRQFDLFSHRVESELGVTPDAETCLLRAHIAQGGVTPLARGDRTAVAAPPAHDSFRPLTVLCCECADRGASTEDSLERIRALRSQVTALVTSYGGQVSSHSGLSLMAYFGWPRAADSAVGDALRAALALCRRMLSVGMLRIGVHSGLSISGELPDELGELSEIALQLRWQAPWGQVVCSTAVAEQLKGQFEFAPLTASSAQLAAYSVGGCVVLGETLSPNDPLRGTLPLVGRQAELGRLLSHWREVCRGQCRMLRISGEAGIGKSALLTELVRHVGAMGARVDFLVCRPETRLTPLAPLRAMIEHSCGITAHDATPTRRQRLHTLLEDRDSGFESSALPALYALLDLDDSATTTQEDLFTVLLDLFRARCRLRPTLLVVEDAHWMDGATQDFVDRLADADLRIMVAVVTRHAHVPAFHHLTHEQVPLRPLEAADAAALLQLLAENRPLDSAAAARLLERSGGIPLYLKALAERAGSNARSADIPPSLGAVLRQKIDDAGEDSVRLMAAAVIGQSFSGALLSALLGEEAGLTGARLRQLVACGLLIQEQDDSFSFAHALVHDAAYQCMTRIRRKALHLRLATVMSSRNLELAESRPELLANHCSRGGDARHAVYWWRKAGEQALRKQAAEDAAIHFRHALKLVNRHPGMLDEHARLSLMFNLCDALIMSEGLGSAAARKLMNEALPLARRSERPRAYFDTLARLHQGDHPRGLAIAEVLVDAAETPDEQVFAHYALGNSLFCAGRFSESDAALTRMRTLAASLQDASDAGAPTARAGDDVTITGLAIHALVLWFLGRDHDARQTMAKARDAAWKSGNLHSRCYALTFSALLERHRRNADQAAHFAALASELASQHGFALWHCAAELIASWAAAHQGRLHSTAPLDACCAEVDRTYRGARVTALSLAVEALIAMGFKDAALVRVNEAIEAVEEVAERYFLAELFRLKAELLLDLRAAMALNEATTLLKGANDLATEQGAIPLCRRIESSHARVAALRSPG